MVKVDPLKGGAAARVPVGRSRRRGKPHLDAEPERAPGAIPSHLQPLVEEISASGKALERDPTGEHLEHYKLAVRSFLEAALKDSMRLRTEASAGLSRKVFSTITRVDVALAELADAILGRQQDVLKLREIIDQIKGLVIDLYR